MDDESIEVGTDSKALMRQCADGPTVTGIDVSYYQETIDWDRVRNAGIEFAFIRVSDGLRHVDTQFQRNWSEARRVGIRRGAYQYFRPNLDPIEQADLLLTQMGALEPGDLPPVIDVEADGRMSASQVADRVQIWIEHVESALGVVPIIYTGPYFWRDQVGSPSFGSRHPLWNAHYTQQCPLVPEPWSRWTFHQYTDSGSVPGIRGNVDMNYFNGSTADLLRLAQGNGPIPRCEPVEPGGSVFEEDDRCVTLGGPQTYWRKVEDGHGGSHAWTGATASQSTTNYAEWNISVTSADQYEVAAFIAAGAGTTQQAKYVVAHEGGSSEAMIDQRSAFGFVSLGRFDFAPGQTYPIRLADNTGERGERIVVDALRVVEAASQPRTNRSSEVDPNVCQPISVGGGLLQEDGPCVQLGGNERYLRAESGGNNGYVWTGATAHSSAHNYAEWSFAFEQAGTYLVEAYIATDTGSAQRSRYRIAHAGGTDDVIVDHSTAAGFVELGRFTFSSSGGYVKLGDNTGESARYQRRIVFDALRFSPANPTCTRVTVAGVSALNVRPEPGTDFRAIGTLHAGEVADRLATVSGKKVDGNAAWHRIRKGSLVGYISARYATCY